MNDPASACAWFQVNPDLIASMVASFSQELRSTAQPISRYMTARGRVLRAAPAVWS